MNLSIDKILFDKFLSGKQTELEEDQLLKSKLKYESCIDLKYALETCINYMINTNKSKSSFIFYQKYLVNFEDCGLDKDIKELKNIVSKKTGFELKISTNNIIPYFKINSTKLKNLKIKNIAMK